MPGQVFLCVNEEWWQIHGMRFFISHMWEERRNIREVLIIHKYPQSDTMPKNFTLNWNGNENAHLLDYFASLNQEYSPRWWLWGLFPWHSLKGLFWYCSPCWYQVVHYAGNRLFCLFSEISATNGACLQNLTDELRWVENLFKTISSLESQVSMKFISNHSNHHNFFDSCTVTFHYQ